MTEFSKLCLRGQIQPIDHFSVTYELRMVFIFWTVETIQKKNFISWCDNSMKIKSRHPWIKFYWNTATFTVNVLAIAPFVLQWQNQIVAAKTIWPVTPTAFTIWPFTEKFANPFSIRKRIFIDPENTQYYFQIQWITVIICKLAHYSCICVYICMWLDMVI